MEWSSFIGGIVIGITVAAIFDVIRSYIASRPSKRDMTINELREMVEAMMLHPHEPNEPDTEEGNMEMNNDIPFVETEKEQTDTPPSTVGDAECRRRIEAAQGLADAER